MRWALSWVLYWIGDAVSRVMLRGDWLWPYRLYNWLMCKSAYVQGLVTNPGPWGLPDPESE